jgi:uracil-DNA glycosylase
MPAQCREGNARRMTAVLPSAAPFLPAADRSLESLRAAAASCQGCDLYKNATQTVFGRGPIGATMALVGEQPGDKEDIEGEPFVGPAGRMLDKALETLGLDRRQFYVTNAVKHFKWVPKGKQRIHQTPRASEVRACLPWFEAELEAVRPKMVVALGAVAVGALLGPEVKVMKQRGSVVESTYGPCLVTVHPSSLLRVEEPEERHAAFELFLRDLRNGLDFLKRSAA